MRMVSRFGGNIDWQMSIKGKMETALRIALGVCFILSGIMKAVNVYSFAQEIRLYIEAYMDSCFVQWTVEIAVVICAIETVTGLLALKREYVAVVSVVLLVIMSFFVWLTGINLFCPSLMGSIESCGCFGELVHLSPLASFVKSVVLWGMSVGLFGLCLRTDWGKSFLKNFLMDGKTYAILVAGTLPPVYSYLYLENMDHIWYLAGYIVLCIIIVSSLGFCYVIRK